MAPKKDKNQGNAANAATGEIQGAFFLSVDSSIDSCVLDSGVSFHTTTHHEIMKNYVAKNYGIYIADGELLYIVSFGYICLKISNKAM